MHIELDHQPNQALSPPTSLMPVNVRFRAVDPAMLTKDFIGLPRIFRPVMRDPATFHERRVRRPR
jgi:hypothetical protein